MSEGVLTTGVVIRRRATTEWMARGGWFLFFLGGCSGVGGEFFHTLRRDGTRRFWFGGLFHMLWSGCTRGGWFWFGDNFWRPAIF